MLRRWKLLENRNRLVRGRQLSEGIAISNYVYSPITFTAVAPVCENEYLSEPRLINAVNQTCTINVEVMRNGGSVGISKAVRFEIITFACMKYRRYLIIKPVNTGKSELRCVDRRCLNVTIKRDGLIST